MATSTEERTQDFAAIIGQDAAGYFWAPMAGRLLEQPRPMHHRPTLRVLGAIDQPADPGVTDGARAHRAGLQGDDHGQPRQPVGSQRGAGGAQYLDLGVGGRIVAGDRRVGSLGQHFAGDGVEDQRADRNLSGLGGGLRLREGDAHGDKIMVGHPKHRRDTKPPGQAVSRRSPGPPPTQARPVEISESAAGDRVAKALARAGVASRREVERLIEGGKVALNGQILTSPAVTVKAGDVLAVDGAVVNAAEATRVFRYHKPAGLVTSHNDPRGRPTVFDALPPELPRLISVGRLDLNSEGLLLLTNDGGLSRALELPSSGWPRRYRARAWGRVDQARLDTLKDGITVEGVNYGPIDARLDKAKEGVTGANLWLTLTLAEGKNREVRRVLEALGLTVNRLIRLAYGPFALGTLEVGGVEEVGPRVIREQLVGLVSPANMPTSDRALFKAAGGQNRRAPQGKAFAGNRTAGDPLPPITYKPGWARPKKKVIGTGAPKGPRVRAPKPTKP